MRDTSCTGITAVKVRSSGVLSDHILEPFALCLGPCVFRNSNTADPHVIPDGTFAV